MRFCIFLVSAVKYRYFFGPLPKNMRIDLFSLISVLNVGLNLLDLGQRILDELEQQFFFI